MESDEEKESKKKTSFISKTAMTVLTIILIILFFCIMSMVEKIQGTARVVNYAGLVRGKTQRLSSWRMRENRRIR